MDLDQNTYIWILVCISVIYCCIKVNGVGFLCIVLATAILLYLKKELSLEPYTTIKTKDAAVTTALLVVVSVVVAGLVSVVSIVVLSVVVFPVLTV